MKKRIYNPVTGKYYEVSEPPPSPPKGSIKGLWNYHRRGRSRGTRS